MYSLERSKNECKNFQKIYEDLEYFDLCRQYLFDSNANCIGYENVIGVSLVRRPNYKMAYQI